MKKSLYFKYFFGFVLLSFTIACGGGSGVGGAKLFLTADTGTPFSENPITQNGSPGDVDVLFVLDSSLSLEAERDNLANSISQLMGEIRDSETQSFATAIILGWMSSTATTDYEGSGHLLPFSPGTYVLNSDSMSKTDISTTLSAALRTTPPIDETADGGEAGLYALNQLLSVHFQEARDRGFLREKTPLVVIFLSDENAICADYPNGVEPVEDPQNIEEGARANCGDLTVSDIIARARTVTNTSQCQMSGIIYTGPDVPTGNENEIGYGYLEAIEKSDGVAVDLASADFSTGARNLGNSINALAAQIQRVFSLSQTNVNPLSIEVLVDGVPVTFRYLRADNLVVLDFAGHVGSIVQIDYRVLDS